MRVTSFIRLAFSSLSLLVTLACGGGDTTDNAGAQGGSAGTTVGGGGKAGSSAGGSSAGIGGWSGAAGSSGGGTSNTDPPACAQSCQSPSDCFNDGDNPPFDADNWACEESLCRWLGCNDDSECAFFGGVCRFEFLGSPGLSTCTEACTSVDECVETLISVDLDNWKCTDGGCKYEGCLNDGECEADFGAGARCLERPNTYAVCAAPCTSPADCVMDGAPPSADEDNYECRDGLCVSIGCVSNDECTTVQNAPSVCVGL